MTRDLIVVAVLMGGFVSAAEQRGALTIDAPGIVVNMPLVTWPGGRR